MPYIFIVIAIVPWALLTNLFNPSATVQAFAIIFQLFGACMLAILVIRVFKKEQKRLDDKES